jgi:preprotein translocase subunit SecA
MIGSRFNKAIKSIFGDKATARPEGGDSRWWRQVKVEYAKLSVLAMTSLRARTADLQAAHRRARSHKGTRSQVEALRAEIDADPHMDIHAREARTRRSTSLEERHREAIEEVLLEILPEAFAMVKETARRFKENKESACAPPTWTGTRHQTREHPHRRR